MSETDADKVEGAEEAVADLNLEGALPPPDPDFIIARRSTEELKRFVLDYCDGKIYTLHDVPPVARNCVNIIFLCLALSPPRTPAEGWESFGTLYEYWDQAGPRSINGQPIFWSHHYMHADDWKRVVPAIQRELKRRKEATDIEL
jgi:hypothetical protein